MSSLRIIARRILVGAILLFAVVYICDDASVRYRIPRTRNPFGVVRVQRYYAVTKKDGKPDFYFEPPQEQVCVRSLFSHLGYSPCWYLNRRKVQRIDM